VVCLYDFSNSVCTGQELRYIFGPDAYLATLIVARLIAGIFGSSPLANAGGTLADIWMPHQRGKAMSVFAAAPFLGPVIGPVVGGFLSQYGFSQVVY
jgi:MFS family permease